MTRHWFLFAALLCLSSNVYSQDSKTAEPRSENRGSRGNGDDASRQRNESPSGGTSGLSTPSNPQTENNEAQNNSDIRTIIQRVQKSTVTIKVRGRDGDQIGLGTGFVIDESGLVATNFHVITEGRPFTVEMASGRKLPVKAVEASDRQLDLAIVRVDFADEPIPALKLSQAEPPEQGTQVLAFGNPLGLRDSVVTGIVSALRDIEGQSMIQLAMPTQPGNSGGPLVDLSGNVIGIVNMKSAVDDNLGFAIPTERLSTLFTQPNPIAIDRWVRLGRIDPQRWTPLFDASWTQRGNILNAQGLGTAFGGRSLLLYRDDAKSGRDDFEIVVQVRLDDERGAAGLAFCSDGKDRHYGFYPSNGMLRLTCFKGPSVYDWQVLEEIESGHYLPGDWNRLRVRVQADKLMCYLNGELVIESTDRQLTSGQVGLVKFRDTKPQFKQFQVGEDLRLPTLSEPSRATLAELIARPQQMTDLPVEQLVELGRARNVVNREISKQVNQLEARIAGLRRVAEDLELIPTLRELEEIVQNSEASSDQLVRATLVIAKLDQPDLDVDSYVNRIAKMAAEIQQGLPSDPSASDKRDAIRRYLFEQNGFRGGRAEYYHPANSHLNQVIDDREGLPIALSILYLSIGQALELNVEGVGLPGHFVVRDRTEQPSVLIDVFEGGKLLNEEDAANLAGRPLEPEELAAQNDTQILTRVLMNLFQAAGQRQDLSALYRYCEALVVVDAESVTSRRLRAQVRMVTERNKAALADFDWLMQHETSAAAFQQALALRTELVKRMESAKESSPDSSEESTTTDATKPELTPIDGETGDGETVDAETGDSNR